jgi:hypothetical protein
MGQNSSNFTVQIIDANANEEDLDEMARQLLSELRDMQVESVALASGGDAPAGTKSAEMIMAGKIAVAVLPAFLPKIVDFVQAWSLRGQGRAVKFKGKIAGQMVEFEGTSAELQELLVTLSKGKSK